MQRILAGAALGFLSGAAAYKAIFRTLESSDEETVVKDYSSFSLAYGLPEFNSDLYHYNNHVVLYDNAKKVPVWVAEHLTLDNLRGTATREQSQFQCDDYVPRLFRSSNDDYWDSGWSRGHMVPAGDNKHSQEAMNDTFYLTNIVPQDIDNNAYFWCKLERYCRSLARRYNFVEIVSGPLWLPLTTNDGRRFVKYDVIGKNDVAVPTHLFKVVVGENDEEIVIGAFVVPNKDIPDDKQPIDYQRPIDVVEKMVGAKMFPRLDRRQTEDLCERDGCKHLDSPEFELSLFQGIIEGAYSLPRLETVWRRVKKSHPWLVEKLKGAYLNKRKQFQQK
ncbi:nuclease EXOG, mitochondrial-like [Corticium candelabrum]|uniref:nuclease EXOG, mitochondrial-like n=1 Tax=Corticium candelabrum TaxID=121492 RepID=UPI002E274D84|nr:nuclease EXOG, mitochondrial-like [Corticium candelabrum]